MNRYYRLAATALLSGATWAGGMVGAQTPALTSSAATTARKAYVNKSRFTLPAIINNLDVSKLQELKLYVKMGNGEWVCKTSTPPTQPSFECNVAQDGEYWFSIVAVDKSGKPTTPNLQEASSILIVVDTTPPEVEVHSVGASSDGQLECKIRDVNPDYTNLKIEYATPGNSWQSMEPMMERVGQFHMPAGQPLPPSVRVTATDRAGNTVSRSVALAPTETTPALTRVEYRSEKPLPVGGPDLLSPASGKLPDPVPELPREVASNKAPNPLVLDTAMSGLAEAPPTATKVAEASSTHSLPHRQFVNHRHISLKYQIEQMGPSGVGKVEVWLTRDMGQTWQYLCDDPDRKSPVEVELPGDGLMGLSLVVRNGIGFGGKPPARGETANWWVEVDTTKPVAELREIQPLQGGESPTLLILWKASDKNLGEEPIHLSYSASKAGPWMPIANRVRNEGSYRWALPPGVGGQVYVRLQATDEAGNCTICETHDPVVIDLSLPKVRVIGLEVEGRPLTMNAN